jgi:ABC-type branched-subunit amino acid transport system substrate-binding protein
MKQYRVIFFWGTDRRAEHVVTAYDDLKALAQALNVEGINNWIVDPHMRIEIRPA